MKAGGAKVQEQLGHQCGLNARLDSLMQPVLKSKKGVCGGTVGMAAQHVPGPGFDLLKSTMENVLWLGVHLCN